MLKSIAASYSRQSRARRAALLAQHITLRPEDYVLDLGGGTGEHFNSIFPEHKNVVIADVSERELRIAKWRYGYVTVTLDDNSTALPFADSVFDVVFCSSVIEHATGPKINVEWTKDGASFEKTARKHQWALAKEIRRIAKRYYVQTPYRYFALESHSWLPGLIVLLPRPALVALLRFTNLFWPKRTSPDWRLLTIREFTQMFPDAKISCERSWGLVKSLMAIKA